MQLRVTIHDSKKRDFHFENGHFACVTNRDFFALERKVTYDTPYKVLHYSGADLAVH